MAWGAFEGLKGDTLRATREETRKKTRKRAMTQGAIGRLVKVEPGEGGKVLLFSLLGALLQAGVSIGLAASDSLFLAHVGPASLPRVYLLSLAVMIVYVRVYGVLIGRFGIARTLQGTATLLGLLGVGVYLLLSSQGAFDTPLAQVGLYGLKLYALLWYVALYSLQWSFTDDYFGIQDAKRLFPVLSAGAALGAVAGGAVVAIAGERTGVPGLFLVWSGLAFAVIPVVFFVRRLFATADAEEEQEGSSTMVEQVSSLVRGIRGSRYVLLLTATLFAILVVTSLAEFQYMTVFAQGRTEEQLAALFGRLYAVASGINVFVSLLVFNRIVGRLGVPNTALIQPLVYVVAFGLLFAYPGEAAAVVAFLAHQAILTSIDYNNVNLLLKALPAEGKKAIRTLIEGLGEPMAVASAGALLLVLTASLSPEQISGVGLMGGVGCLGLVLVLRTEYPAAMVQNLKREWVEFGSGKGVRETAQYIALGIEDSSEVVPLLQGTLDASARERRAVEMAVVVLGLKTVPSTLSILQDPLQPHRIRSLAARIAGRLAPAQLEAMADDLVESELERAVEYARARSALAVVERGPGLATLFHLTREIPEAIVDFVLEIHALTGRLPSAELLAASLRSVNPRERGEALETLEQGCTRRVFRRIAALVRAASPRSDPSRTVSVEDWVRHGLDSSIPLERAAAVTALPEAFPGPRAAGLLKPLLLREEPPVVNRAALSTLARLSSGRLLPLDPQNDIEVVDLLRRAPLLSDFQTAELAFLVEKSARRFVAEGMPLYSKGEVPDGVFAVLRGKVELEGEGSLFEGLRQGGEVFGDADLFLGRRKHEARSVGAEVLQVSLVGLAECAKRFPRAGLRLVVRRQDVMGGFE